MHEKFSSGQGHYSLNLGKEKPLLDSEGSLKGNKLI
jgi:hypothetical protein